MRVICYIRSCSKHPVFGTGLDLRPEDCGRELDCFEPEPEVPEYRVHRINSQSIGTYAQLTCRFDVDEDRKHIAELRARIETAREG